MLRNPRNLCWVVALSLIVFFSLDPLLFGNDNRIAQIQDVKKGVFIVADPRIADSNFSRTVVLMLQHDSDGSTGLIINRPTDTPLSSLLPDAAGELSPKDQLYLGGPVLRGTLTILFRSDRPPDHLSPVFANVYASQEARVLSSQLKARESEKDLRLYTGYAGWAPGQLRAEMNRGDWRVVMADTDVVFARNPDAVWPEMFDRSQRRRVRLPASLADS